MDQKPLAIAAVGYSDGLRAFIHSGDGKVKVVGNEAEVDDILSSTDSKNSKKGQWEPGTLQAFCSTQSNLAAFEGQDGLILGLCCQLPDDALALYRRDYKWRLVTEFIGIQRARPGTALATVSSLIAKKVVLFFQDKGGYVCCRRGTWHGTESWRWDGAGRLAEAAPGSGIVATSWKREDDLEEIGLYYQDARFQTVELRLSFSDCGPSDACNNPHSPTPIKEAAGPVSMQVLAAVSWGSVPDIRLYLRDNGNIWQFEPIEDTKQTWRSQLVDLGNISPRTNLAAVARTPRGSDKVVIDILCWSVDKTLNHKLFVHWRGWQETTSIGRRLPVMTPPRLADPYDMAFSGNAIRLEALNEQMGVRDALWTLCNHTKWLKKEVESTSFKRAEDLLEIASRIGFHPATITNSEPSKYIVRHIAALGNLVVRLSRIPAGDSRGRDDLLQQCKVQAARVEVAIESWPDMCEPLQKNLKLAEHIAEGTSLDEIEAFEGRFDDICQVFSSTVARGKEQALERGGIKIFVATALVAQRREALELDEMEHSVRQNSRNARKLRDRFTTSKTRAQSFSTLLVQSTMLPLQSSAQGFARALVEMLEELNSPSAHGAHARMFGDLRKQLATIAG